MPFTRSKKNQSQLNFTPLPDSSPAKNAQPTATRARAAAVTISDSPLSKKKSKVAKGFLPTPEPSSQTVGPSGGLTSSPPVAWQTRSSMKRGAIKNKDATRETVSSPAKPSTHSDLLQNFDDSESDEDLPQLLKKRQKRSLSDGGHDDEDAPIPSSLPRNNSEHSGDDIVTPTRERRGPLRGSSGLDLEDGEDFTVGHNYDSEEELLPSPLDRRQSLPSTPKRFNKRAKQDLDDDVDFLRSASPPRSARSEKKAARSNALEALKKRREKQQQRHSGAGDVESAQAISSDEGEGEDSGQDDEFQENIYYDEDEENAFLDDANAYSDDNDAALPLEIKLQAAKPSELFQYVVQWMVHKRLNPGFDEKNPVYNLAFKRVDDYARGMGSSKFQSSAWTPIFSRALKARPVIEEMRFANMGLHDRCDACNRSRHPATFEVRFKGSVYSPDTLEDLSDDEDEEDEEETSEPAIPRESTIFYIGKWCMANARTAHALEHWRRHLYEWVVDWLEAEDYLEPQKVVQRDRWPTKKRKRYADDVMDMMREKGEVKELHRAFKTEIEAAQNQEVSH